MSAESVIPNVKGNIYEIRRWGTLILLFVAAVMVGIFLWVSSRLVKDLTAQERERMEVWAGATSRIAQAVQEETDQGSEADLEFLLSIITSNHSIPVLLTDEDDNILDQRNFDLPEPVDSLDGVWMSDANIEYLLNRLQELKDSDHVIQIVVAPQVTQYVYYEDSKLLKRLSFYPYVQLLVMLAFIAVVYYALSSTKRAEQNKVWVGLSKETAHQLGTPISSLMAWMEILRAEGLDPSMVDEMDKDVNRLSTIASRFSKVGSKPSLEDAELNKVVEHAVKYMSSRISNRIKITASLSNSTMKVMMSAPLFEWVMENLIKNAVDAIGESGSITVTTGHTDSHAWVEVTDTGKGISRKHIKTIFNPGFTTKTRGWGLGLTLARRIIQQYHGGRIFVAWSEVGQGTTFRIELPMKNIDTTSV